MKSYMKQGNVRCKLRSRGIRKKWRTQMSERWRQFKTISNGVGLVLLKGRMAKGCWRP